MEKEDIDILFLDIELPGENGVSVGEYEEMLWKMKICF